MSDPARTDSLPSGSGSPIAGPITDRFEVRATATDHFAWLRTRASLERTMMSWIRTAVSLIGFGFTIVQFFARMQEITGVNAARHPAAPYFMGLSLISCGVLALVISVWQYEWTIRYLWSGSFGQIAGIEKERRNTPVIAISVLLILIGLFAFFAVLWHFV